MLNYYKTIKLFNNKDTFLGWELDPERRPSFEDLVYQFNTMMMSPRKYVKIKKTRTLGGAMYTSHDGNNQESNFNEGRNIDTYCYVDCLHEGTSDKDGHVDCFNGGPNDKDGYVNCLHEDTNDKDSYVECLREETSDKDGYVDCFNEGHNDKDGYVDCFNEGPNDAVIIKMLPTSIA